MSERTDLRPSPIAGRWYDGHPQRLAQQVDAYLQAAQLPELDGEVVAVIAPHAGHIYSGPTAGYAFKTVQGKSYDLVVVISPLHSYASAALLTSAHWGYSTPLGDIPIDRGAVHQLSQNLTHEMLVEVVHDQEHSLEIELPFLQRALASQFQLLPIMVRSIDPGVSLRLARALLHVLEGRNALLVGSTDLSHFYPLVVAEALDAEMLRQIEAFSPEGMFKAEEEGQGFACGLGAVAAVLHTARGLGATRVKVLHHSTSADQTGDISSVVGYGAAVVLKDRAA